MTLTIVCGTRDLDGKKHRDITFKALENAPFDITKIIHGDARGPDSFADEYAALRDIECNPIQPLYSKYGEQAPLVRDKKMAGRAEALIAIWDGESGGTGFTMEKAKEKGMKKLGVIGYDKYVAVIYMAHRYPYE